MDLFDGNTKTIKENEELKEEIVKLKEEKSNQQDYIDKLECGKVVFECAECDELKEENEEIKKEMGTMYKLIMNDGDKYELSKKQSTINMVQSNISLMLEKLRMMSEEIKKNKEELKEANASFKDNIIKNMLLTIITNDKDGNCEYKIKNYYDGAGADSYNKSLHKYYKKVVEFKDEEQEEKKLKKMGV